MTDSQPQAADSPEEGPPNVLGPSAAVTRAPARALLWAGMVVAALVAGLGSWAGGEAVFGHFGAAFEQPPFEEPPGWNKLNPYARAEVAARQLKIKGIQVLRKNTAIAYGLLGGALGAGLGLVGGLLRRSPRHAFSAALVGLGVGGAAGAGLPLALVPVFYRYLDPEPSRVQTMLPFLTHGGIWVPIGMAAGLACALGLGNRRRIPGAICGGLLGALVGTFLFETANAVAFPLVRVLEPVPSNTTLRLLANLLVAFFTALGVALAVREQGKAALRKGLAA